MYHIVAGLIGREMHAMYEDILPVLQGQTPKFSVHISYFLQK